MTSAKPLSEPVHDPGPAAARARAERIAVDGAPISRPGGGAVRVGTAGWTDPTLTAPGVFYPVGAGSAEDRLRFYASRFPIVEVDAPFYALPSRRSAELWVARTPDDFTFNVKANALMTGHATDVARLPREIREALPDRLRDRHRVYATDLPVVIVDAVWRWFVDALAPLHAAGKLGAVLLQYPKWFVPGEPSRTALLEAKARLGDYPAAVEFRNRRWLTGTTAERTLSFLAEHALPFVAVDAPQGTESSLPPLTAVTYPRLAVIRLHGRRAETWEQRNVSVAERYRYLYTPAELQEWVPRAVQLMREAREVHVLYNNCYANYGTTNALEFMALLRSAVAQADGAAP